MDTNSIRHDESRKSMPLQYFDDDDPPKVDQPTIIRPKQACPRNVDSANSSVDACNAAHGEGDANPTITRTFDASHGDVASPINFNSRPQRERRKPTYLTDYILNGVQTNPNTSLTSGTPYSISHFIAYDKFSPTHRSFLAAISTKDEPKSFSKAIQDPKWRQVMKAIIDALEKNNTWTLETLPLDKMPIGIEVARHPSGIFLCQRKYTLDILTEVGMLGTKPCLFPMKQKLKLTPSTGSSLSDPMQYRRLVGKLIYLTITRPEISFVVPTLSQFMQAPRQPHLDVAMWVLRYLKSSLGQGIFLSSSSSLQLSAYCDFDCASCPTTRRSTIGYLTLLGNSPISWKTKKQSTVSRSSVEAEYRAMASTVSELLWLKGLLKTLGVDTFQPMQLHCDNQAAIHIATNPVFHERTKHIKLDCHFIRHWIQVGLIKTSHVRSNLQVADIFTKALGGDQFQFLLRKLGITDLHAPT
ncbi:hypothetical protein SLEP1_g34168 [Rubroshorea leprosula]|uniref:Reverse transcriptase Ty1/copia-type domain-containing protein n=1 Tax=Rubroshorea leprosula TaxID=152421 RepID=A0AAV5KJ63_9ROSI|nr:hypothetical protein SLEP1_g34168 [Rubroshorea leprosula]